MSVIRSIVRRTARVRRTRGVVRILRGESEIGSAVRTLARGDARESNVVPRRINDLYAHDGTTLYLHIEQKRRPFELVLTRTDATKLIASASGMRLEAETEEPAANGAYLVERQYRRLGFYDRPQVDRAVIFVRIAPGNAPLYLIDYPPYVQFATIVINGEVLEAGVSLSAGKDARYRVSPRAGRRMSRLSIQRFA